MISDKNSDFNIWAERAGGIPAPKIASIVMTIIGARSPKKGLKDLASQMYVEKAYGIAAKHPGLFDYDDPADAFATLTILCQQGRISGAVHSHSSASGWAISHGQGKRLQVNRSQVKYKRELEYLTSIL
jgi:chromosome partitioning protein